MPLKTVDVPTLKRWLDAGEALLVDVREPAEHAAESIEGTALLPLGGLRRGTLPTCEGRKLVLHCRSGARSARACEKLLAEDPALEVYTLEGGIAAWTEAGHAVAGSGRAFLPLDRQVQLVIGLLLLGGSLLGYFFSPVWFVFTGLIGVGLTIAGATGFCGLAVLMARMPWNQRCPCVPAEAPGVG